MPHSKFERDMLIVQQHWNNFVSLIKQDLNELHLELRKKNIEIKRIERIEKILQRSKDNIDFLLLHKDSIIGLDSALTQKFTILEAFKKRENLSNAVALRTFNEILESETLRNAINSIDELIEKRDLLYDQVDKINDLIYGTAFDKETIDQLSKKHNLGAEALTALVVYPIYKSSRKKARDNQRRNTDARQVSVTPTTANLEPNAVPVQETQDESNEIQDEHLEDTFVDLSESSVEIPNYKEQFEEQKKRYEDIRDKSNILLNKYYVILNSMPPVENQYYRVFCSLTEEELKDTVKDQIEGDYDEALAKIVAIKLFDAKSEIEKLFKSIVAANYSNLEDIEFLGEYINEYQILTDKLIEIDKKIREVKKETEKINEEQQKVFFLTDKAMKPFIPGTVYEKSYRDSLLSIINKGEEGHIQRKKGCDVKELKPSKFFKEKCGRTVFMLTNNKIIASYVKLNSGTGLNDGGIMIITVCVKNPNTIQEDTEKIVRENREQIIRQIEAIEKADVQQLGLQSIIMEGITQNEEQTLGEGEINGPQTK